jgi:hypothetical protein
LRFTFPEPLIELELDLLRIRQCARSGETERARGYARGVIDLLQREPSLPGTYAMIATATVLAEGMGDVNDADRFGGMLAEFPSTARLAALRPFLVGAPARKMTAFSQTHDCLYELIRWLATARIEGAPGQEAAAEEFEKFWA